MAHWTIAVSNADGEEYLEEYVTLEDVLNEALYRAISGGKVDIYNPDGEKLYNLDSYEGRVTISGEVY